MSRTQFYDPSQFVVCPECGKHTDSPPTPAEDYVVPGRVDAASQSSDQCGYCESPFMALRQFTDGRIRIEWLDAEDEGESA
jgi:hypothetical protein